MANQDVFATAATAPLPAIRKITLSDLREALAKGLDDFWAMPTHVVFISLIYPIVGLFLARLAFGYEVLPLLFPLAAGFALIGPFAAIGLYELSWRREQGLDASWRHAFDVFHSPSFGAIAALGLVLTAIFVVWVAVANAIYIAYFGYATPPSVGHFVEQVLTTSAGWRLIVVGNAVGFLFAVAASMLSVIAFPLLIDRNVGAAAAALTSVRAVLKNPLPMVAWGLIVTALLVLGSIPFFIGLAVVMPLLGHSTWHLYRKVVESDMHAPEEHRRPPRNPRYAAEFPASLFARSDEPGGQR